MDITLRGFWGVSFLGFVAAGLAGLLFGKMKAKKGPNFDEEEAEAEAKKEADAAKARKKRTRGRDSLFTSKETNVGGVGVKTLGVG